MLQHILYAHGPWFAKEYGSLAIWNTQGMEKSHKQARVAYQKNSQHGGSSSLSNPLVQMFQWFYRRILSRFNATDMESDDLAEKCRRDEEIRCKREIYEQSNGKDASVEWVLEEEVANHNWSRHTQSIIFYFIYVSERTV